jgi:hypothetical protein
MSQRFPSRHVCLCLLCVAGLQVLVPAAAANSAATATPRGRNLPIIIYYGLNGSDSRSWARVAPDGAAALSLFERFGPDTTAGALIYKTIAPDGAQNADTITVGTRLEKSVLLLDEQASPHVFVARSDNTDQTITHYWRGADGGWQAETFLHFHNDGGKFIYEMSATKGPDGSFHLLVLKTRSDIDSDDYWWAWLDSNLYHVTNVTGAWERELIHHYDMAYTYDTTIKCSNRQDIKVDANGVVHVCFSEQINAYDDPSRLLYANNSTGSWEIETALHYDHGPRDDAGWFPSLCLDNQGTPHISCMYVHRVYTRSAIYCRLLLLKRVGGEWQQEVVADRDDGYYGNDGHDYTGGLTHLVFDRNNDPHIAFTDIASSHWRSNYLNVGNIRYAVRRSGTWNYTTVYRQPLPTGFLHATEMYGLCLLLSEDTGQVRIVGQELVIDGEDHYTCGLLDFAWSEGEDVETSSGSAASLELGQNHPNPFQAATFIDYQIPCGSDVRLRIYDVCGREVRTLVDGFRPAASYSLRFDAGSLPSGIYFYGLSAGGRPCVTRRMVLVR